MMRRIWTVCLLALTFSASAQRATLIGTYTLPRLSLSQFDNPACTEAALQKAAGQNPSDPSDPSTQSATATSASGADSTSSTDPATGITGYRCLGDSARRLSKLCVL